MKVVRDLPGHVVLALPSASLSCDYSGPRESTCPQRVPLFDYPR